MSGGRLCGWSHIVVETAKRWRRIKGEGGITVQLILSILYRFVIRGGQAISLDFLWKILCVFQAECLRHLSQRQSGSGATLSSVTRILTSTFLLLCYTLSKGHLPLVAICQTEKQHIVTSEIEEILHISTKLRLR